MIVRMRIQEWTMKEIRLIKKERKEKKWGEMMKNV